MEVGVCEPLKPFNFYSLDDFDYRQLISRSHYFVGSFVNKETKLAYVVKETPYSERAVQILKRIDRVSHNCLTPLLGVSLYRSKTGGEGQRLKREGRSPKEHVSLLLFMEKYEMNLLEYVVSRRKKHQAFSREEVSSFLVQMLAVLERLQREGLAHRDVKPENILYNKGSYLLCDFDDVVEVSSRERPQVELTTVFYSSPEFLKNMRHPKDKYFDPFKLDVYSLGLTLLYMCSMGRFSLEQRSHYIYESSQHSHADFIKEERRKWVAKNSQFKLFNPMLKMMLEEDEYKRDDFLTLSIKSKNKGEYERAYSDNKSDERSNSKAGQTLRTRKGRKVARALREQQLRGKEARVYCGLTAALIVLFVLVCLI